MGGSRFAQTEHPEPPKCAVKLDVRRGVCPAHQQQVQSDLVSAGNATSWQVINSLALSVALTAEDKLHYLNATRMRSWHCLTAGGRSNSVPPHPWQPRPHHLFTLIAGKCWDPFQWRVKSSLPPAKVHILRFLPTD